MMFFREMLLPWACVHLALLVAATHAQCYRGSATQCRNADFVPGHNLGGEGFDVTTIQRKGAYVIDVESFRINKGTCTLCRNSQHGNKLQKLPRSVLDWRVDLSCSLSVSSTLHESSLSFANSTSSNIENDWSIGLNVKVKPELAVGVVVAGSYSKLAQFAMEHDKRDKYSYSSQELLCKLYRYRIHDFPKLHPIFYDQLQLLPKAYNNSTRQRFRNLIDIYGTHYIRQVSLGGRVREITALKTCEVALQQLNTNEVKDCLGVEASLSIKGITSGFAINKCKMLRDAKLSQQKFSDTYSDRRFVVMGGSLDAYVDLLFPKGNQNSAYEPWVRSLKKNPDVIAYSLTPLHDLVPYGDSRKDILRQVITEYIMERSIKKKCGVCPPGASLSQHVTCNCMCQASGHLTTDCCSKSRGLASMSVMVERGYGLQGDPGNPPDPYVKVFYGGMEKRTGWIQDNYNLTWYTVFSFGTMILSPFQKIVIEVWDKDVWFDDLLGDCHITADSALGERRGDCIAFGGHITFRYTIQCGPYLTGAYCTEYLSRPQ